MRLRNEADDDANPKEVIHLNSVYRTRIKREKRQLIMKVFCGGIKVFSSIKKHCLNLIIICSNSDDDNTLIIPNFLSPEASYAPCKIRI